MTVRHFIRSILLSSSLILSSCAYMQTHKNIEESYRQRSGYQLTPELELYQAGGRYYLAADKQAYRKDYPAIYDSIFLKGKNEPALIKIGQDSTKVYRSISSGTAQVLQMENGYADLAVLSDELKSSSGEWMTSLPANSRRCKTRAEITGTTTTWLNEETPQPVPAGIKALSIIDQVVIDWPGTILYNTAIPIMAPFVFFHEFLNEE